jgi:hypothetical protein
MEVAEWIENDKIIKEGDENGKFDWIDLEVFRSAVIKEESQRRHGFLDFTSFE